MLDALLGIPKRIKITDSVKLDIVKAASEMSYKKQEGMVAINPKNVILKVQSANCMTYCNISK